MRFLASSCLLLTIAAPVAAQTLRPLAEVRVREEHVAQDGLPQDSDAVTVRVRSGVEATQGRWSALAEVQGNLAIVGDYYDGIDGPATIRPLIGDPQSVGLYRAQLQYRAPGATVTADRQRIMLEDERFVGGAAIRNNGQSFDAVRVQLEPATGVKADVSYVWNVQTVWGIDGTGARPRSIDGDTVLATLGVATPIGTATGFAYLLDLNEAALQGFRLSSQTYGARLAGTRAFGHARLSWQASYARQSDYARNPLRFSADYWLADVALDLNGPRVGAGYEVLGADDGRALTSFQTPLAAVFKFQGWADKFTTTPPDGIRDAYASAGWGWKQAGRWSGVSLQAVYHRFDSDRIVRRYGEEVDLLATGKLGRTVASLRYADYRAQGFGTDTKKLWVQLDWAI